MMEPPGSARTAEITHRTLKNEQGRVFREIEARGVMVVRNRGRIDGILMSPGLFAELRSRADEGDRLRAALPLLLAAARSGVMIPSETFAVLGIPGRYDWEALDDLLSAVPVRVTHDEGGAPLPDVAGMPLHHTPLAEDAEELVVADQ